MVGPECKERNGGLDESFAKFVSKFGGAHETFGGVRVALTSCGPFTLIMLIVKAIFSKFERQIG